MQIFFSMPPPIFWSAKRTSSRRAQKCLLTQQSNDSAKDVWISSGLNAVLKPNRVYRLIILWTKREACILKVFNFPEFVDLTEERDRLVQPVLISVPRKLKWGAAIIEDQIKHLVYWTEEQIARCILWETADLNFNPISEIDRHKVGAVHGGVEWLRAWRHLDVALSICQVHAALTWKRKRHMQISQIDKQLDLPSGSSWFSRTGITDWWTVDHMHTRKVN